MPSPATGQPSLLHVQCPKCGKATFHKLHVQALQAHMGQCKGINHLSTVNNTVNTVPKNLNRSLSAPLLASANDPISSLSDTSQNLYRQADTKEDEESLLKSSSFTSEDFTEAADDGSVKPELPSSTDQSENKKPEVKSSWLVTAAAYFFSIINSLGCGMMLAGSCISVGLLVNGALTLPFLHWAIVFLVCGPVSNLLTNIGTVPNTFRRLIVEGGIMDREDEHDHKIKDKDGNNVPLEFKDKLKMWGAIGLSLMAGLAHATYTFYSASVLIPAISYFFAVPAVSLVGPLLFIGSLGAFGALVCNSSQMLFRLRKIIQRTGNFIDHLKEDWKQLTDPQSDISDINSDMLYDHNKGKSVERRKWERRLTAFGYMVMAPLAVAGLVTTMMVTVGASSKFMSEYVWAGTGISTTASLAVGIAIAIGAGTARIFTHISNFYTSMAVVSGVSKIVEQKGPSIDPVVQQAYENREQRMMRRHPEIYEREQAVNRFIFATSDILFKIKAPFFLACSTLNGLGHGIISVQGEGSGELDLVSVAAGTGGTINSLATGLRWVVEYLKKTAPKKDEYRTARMMEYASGGGPRFYAKVNTSRPRVGRHTTHTRPRLGRN